MKKSISFNELKKAICSESKMPKRHGINEATVVDDPEYMLQQAEAMFKENPEFNEDEDLKFDLVDFLYLNRLDPEVELKKYPALRKAVYFDIETILPKVKRSHKREEEEALRNLYKAKAADAFERILDNIGIPEEEVDEVAESKVARRSYRPRR